MVAWQYDKINLNELTRNGDDIALLGAAGKQGWELVAIMPHGIAYLKRQLGTEIPVQPSAQRSVSSRKKPE